MGFEGVKSFYDEVLRKLKKEDEYLAVTFSDENLDSKSLVLMFQKFHQKRANIGAKAKILCNVEDKKIQERMNYSETELYEFRVTDQILPPGIVVVKDMVVTFNWEKTPRVFVTICEENAQHYRKFFYSVLDEAQSV